VSCYDAILKGTNKFYLDTFTKINNRELADLYNLRQLRFQIVPNPDLNKFLANCVREFFVVAEIKNTIFIYYIGFSAGVIQ
jgi:hypothetical protein